MRRRLHRQTTNPRNPETSLPAHLWPAVKAALDPLYRESEEEARQAYLRFLRAVAEKEASERSAESSNRQPAGIRPDPTQKGEKGGATASRDDPA